MIFAKKIVTVFIGIFFHPGFYVLCQIGYLVQVLVEFSKSLMMYAGMRFIACPSNDFF